MAETAFWLATLLLVFNQVHVLELPISVPDFLYVFAFLAIILDGISKKKPLHEWMPIHKLWIPAFLMLVGGLLASLAAFSTASSVKVTLVAFYIFTFWVGMVMVLARRGHIARIITALVLGTFFTSAVAIADFLFGTQIGLSLTSIGQNKVDQILWFRSAGTMGHPNELAMLIAVVAPLVLNRVLMSGHISVAYRLSNTMVFFVLCLALVFTGSATGYIGIAISCTVVLLVRVISSRLLARPHILVGGLLSTLFIGLMILIAFSSPLVGQLDIISKLTQQNMLYRVTEYTGPARLSLIQDALDLITENPLWGAGMDQTGNGGLDRIDLVTSIYIHNTLLEFWLAGGIVVFVGVLILYWQVLRTATRGIIKSLGNTASPYMLGLSASCIGWIIMDMVQPELYQRYKWLVFAVLFSLTATQEKLAHKAALQVIPARPVQHYGLLPSIGVRE